VIRRVPRFPIAFLALLLACGSVLALNRYLIAHGFDTGSARSWPFWEFEWGDPRQGLAFLPLYLFCVTVLVVRIKRLCLAESFALGLAIVLSGNLMQGGVHQAFVAPFIESGFQYYHDAIKIRDSWEWLRNFNTVQAGLLMHTRTHPPFGVLLHHIILRAGGGSVGLLSSVFIILSLLSIPLLYAVCRQIGMTRQRASAIAGILAVVPAFNIYSAVCLDGVIAMTSSIALLGITQVRAGARPLAAALLILGFLVTNMLTFAGLYLVPVLIGIILYDARAGDGLRWKRPIAWLFAVAVLAYALGLACGYDHLAALRTASRIENPDGLLLFAHPVKYFMTRLEDLGEIVVFLLVPLAAILSQRGTAEKTPAQRSTIVLAVAGSAAVILMFVSGAYRTGQTARGCLFLVPYVLPLLHSTEEKSLKLLIGAAAAQAAGMQLCGRWFW
jgi:hypothetical protein